MAAQRSSSRQSCSARMLSTALVILVVAALMARCPLGPCLLLALCWLSLKCRRPMPRWHVRSIPCNDSLSPVICLSHFKTSPPIVWSFIFS
ncbi:hypothetical protein BDN71DRAFT_244625 [Pleurotus eryngii]|uniref:Uncharacterized protein n=1 Tax=Pleurotus eryngii TaxID=5323 RepID=A0A9P6DBW3_PLEER|nr:hypothetical protein BDN71DRAFT_244625 [Pleurotus eryngii]